MKLRIVVIFAVIVTLISAGVGIWCFSPKPPKADIVTITDLHQLNTDEDWQGKIIRWEITESTLESYDQNNEKYAFLGKVKVKGAPGETYGQFNMYDVHKRPNVLIGDVLYVQVTELEQNIVFGAVVKGDILYIEKGSHH